MEQKNRIHIWEGSVGVTIEQKQNKETGEPFFTFEPVRCFKREGKDEFEYSHSFTANNAEALGVVLSKTIDYINRESSSL